MAITFCARNCFYSICVNGVIYISRFRARALCLFPRARARSAIFNKVTKYIYLHTTHVRVMVWCVVLYLFSHWPLECGFCFGVAKWRPFQVWVVFFCCERGLNVFAYPCHFGACREEGWLSMGQCVPLGNAGQKPATHTHIYIYNNWWMDEWVEWNGLARRSIDAILLLRTYTTYTSIPIFRHFAFRLFAYWPNGMRIVCGSGCCRFSRGHSFAGVGRRVAVVLVDWIYILDKC